MDSIDCTWTIFGKIAVSHHGLLCASVLIIDWNDHRIVVLDWFGEFKRNHVVQVKQNLSILDLLIDAFAYRHVLNVILSVGSVEHFGCIICILFLGNAGVDANVSIALSIKFKLYLKLCLFGDPGPDRFFIESDFDVEIL